MPRPCGWRALTAIIHMPRPYGFVNDDNPMHIVRHDHMRAQFNKLKMIGDGALTFVRDFAVFIQKHFPIYDLAKQTIAVISDNGHVICAFGGIIISV